MRIKKFLNSAISIVIIFTILSGSSFTSTGQNVSTTNKYGNSLGNIINNGMVTKQGNYIYYVNYRNDNFIYKMKTDLSGRTQVNSDPSHDLGIIGDWIFYVNGNDNYKVYKIKTDGSGKKKISVVGDWIYYLAGRDTKKLYRVKTDGSNKKQLSSSYTSYINVIGDWIYYSADGYICKIKTDGSKKTKLYKCFSSNINVVGEYIYFINNSDGMKLYKLKIDGTGKKVLNNGKAYKLNVSGSWLYFDTGYGISRIKTDGSGLKVILKGNGLIEAIFIIDNLVYFIQEDNGVIFYRMNGDGTNMERLDGLKVQISSKPDVINGKANYYGNSNGNINNDGVVTDQGDMVYYTIWKNNSTVLCKEKKDGTGTVMFSIADAQSINVIGDWIYYIDNEKLYKVMTSGAQKTYLAGDYIFDAHAAGDWIYYVTLGVNSKDLYRIKTDGTGKEKLCGSIGNLHFNVTQDSIYYIEEKQDDLYKMDLDGKNKKLVSTLSLDSFIVDGEWIYSVGMLNSHKIVKMKLDGTDKHNVTNVAAIYFNLSEGWIYYKNRSDWKLYKVKTDGSSNTKLSDREMSSINVVGDWIYYTSTKDVNEHRRMKIDGTNDQKLND